MPPAGRGRKGRGRGRGGDSFEAKCGRGGGPQRGGRGRWDRREKDFKRSHDFNPFSEVSVLDDLTYIREIPLPSSNEYSSTSTSDSKRSVKASSKDTETTQPFIRVAVQGCGHGKLTRIYDALEEYAKLHSVTVDLLLCCGDFECSRDMTDLENMAAPPKYQTMGDFHEYYSGKRVAPILTVFVGGNHEASAYLQELRYGGWVAPNIYFLGVAGVVNVGGLRIAGMGGIFKEQDYFKGVYERPPYGKSSLHSVFHVRATDVYRMKCLGHSHLVRQVNGEASSSSAAVDIMMSHDWPKGIEQYGDKAGLLRKKRYFQESIDRDNFGSPANRVVLRSLRPLWWFAAHMHVRFEATVHHQQAAVRKPTGAIVAKKTTKKWGNTKPGATISSSTTFLGLESADSCATNGPIEDLTTQMTRFLSLDKCLPRRHYMEIVHMPCKLPLDKTDELCSKTDNPLNRPLRLEYDLEWLAILKKTHTLTTPRNVFVNVPSNLVAITEDDLEEVRMDIINHALRRQQQQQQTWYVQTDNSSESSSDGESTENNSDNDDAVDDEDEERTEGSSFHKDDDESNTNNSFDGFHDEDKGEETAQSETVENYLEIPLNFQITVPPYGTSSHGCRSGTILGNPQTDEFLDMLGLHHIVTVPYNDNEFDFDDEDDN